MDPNQRYREEIITEEQDDNLLLYEGEIGNGKKNKTHLCRKEK